MSYQSPYQPPPPHYPNYNYYQQDALAPARRAGMLMYILGGLTLLSSMCCVGVGALLPQMMIERPEAFAEFHRQMPDATSQMLQIVFFASAGISLVSALAMIILGRSVRSGSKAAIIISLVLGVLAIFVLLFYAVVEMIAGRNQLSQAAGAVCMLVVPIGLLVLLLTWLFGALKASDHVASQQYAMQYWQYAQQQQYGQQAYGQPQPPPHQLPAQSPPPPPPPSGDSSGPPAQG